MESKAKFDLSYQTSVRPQFNVGGQVSVLRTSLPSLASPTASDTTQFLSWATTSRHTTTDFQTEINNLKLFDKTPPRSAMTATRSRSLNPELLMKEFMHEDSQSDGESSTAGFKSSFAREVMQNVRKNERQQQQTPARRYLAINNKDNSSEDQFQSVKNHSFYGSVKDNLSPIRNGGGRQSMPAINTSRRSSNFTSSKFRSQFAVKSHLLHDEDSDDREGTLRDEQWMTSNQFKAVLDNQEELDHDHTLDNENDFYDNDNNLTTSYLDQEAKIPFRKLKQTCDDLGFTFSEQEWSEMRRLLAVESEQRSGDDIVVRNADFFAAVHLIMSNKHNRNSRRDETFKYSMKSDSGGEMESCRSSDSELERELHEKEREIHQLKREVTSNCRSLAERDTELFRVRLECQRLLDDNRSLRDQMARIKLYGPQSKRQLELETEVDQLRWKLVAMEDSRRTYENATERLVVFLEQVTTMLQTTSPSQRKFIESTRAEVSKIAKRTRAQNNKRFSLDSSSIFRAESMPGLNSSMASSSGVGMSAGNFHGSLLSLSTTMSGGDATTTTASSVSSNRSSSVMARRASSSTSSSAIVQRSQSTHSKRSTPNLPSVRERQEKSESIYVNSDIIREFIAEESIDGLNDLPRPQSAAAILHGKRHVCEIKIGSTGKEEIQVKEKKRSTSVASTPAGGSNSVLSSSSTSTSRIHIPNQKASKILGLDPQQVIIQNFSADSGRFSLSSRTSSASAHSSPILPSKVSVGKKSSMKDREDEILVIEESAILLKDEGDDQQQQQLPLNGLAKVEKSRKKDKHQNKVIEIFPAERPRLRMDLEVEKGQEDKILPNRVQKISLKAKDSMKENTPVKEPRSSSNPPPKESRLKEEDKAKFKSLGDLYIEKGLPVAPTPVDCEVDEDKKQLVIKAAHSLMRGVRSMMSRDKTLTITPKKTSSKSLTTVSLNREKKTPTLQLLSHTSFPGLPTYPVLAASHSSPWNC